MLYFAPLIWVGSVDFEVRVMQRLQGAACGLCASSAGFLGSLDLLAARPGGDVQPASGEITFTERGVTMEQSSALQHPEMISGIAVAGLLGHSDGDVTARLLDRLPQAVVLVDPKGTVVRLNKRAAAIVAQGEGLMIGRGS
jgi:PAS domain-containing protein